MVDHILDLAILKGASREGHDPVAHQNALQIDGLVVGLDEVVHIDELGQVRNVFARVTLTSNPERVLGILGVFNEEV